MKQTQEFEGKNVDQAIDNACALLSLTRKNLKYDIISSGSSGIFGIVGMKKARIRVTLPEKKGGPGKNNKKADTTDMDGVMSIVDEAFGEKKEGKPQDGKIKGDKPGASGPEKAESKPGEPREAEVKKSSGKPQAPKQRETKPPESTGSAKPGPGKTKNGEPGGDAKPAPGKTKNGESGGEAKPAPGKIENGESAGGAASKPSETREEAPAAQATPKPAEPSKREMKKTEQTVKEDPELENAPTGEVLESVEEETSFRVTVDRDEGFPPSYRDEEPVDVPEEAIALGKATLQKMIDLITEDATVTAESDQDKLLLRVNGGNSGVLIGRRGQTLEAMQFLTDKIINRKSDSRVRLKIDIEGYMETRTANLKSLAFKMADKAKKTGKPATINQMTAQDRRIVHLALKDDFKVRTQSMGDGYYRRLVIFPKQGAAKKKRSSRK